MKSMSINYPDEIQVKLNKQIEKTNGDILIDIEGVVQKPKVKKNIKKSNGFNTKKKTRKKKKKRKRSESTKIIEEEEVDKTELRKIRNREAAKASRERRKKYLRDLEDSNDRLTKTNYSLFNENQSLKYENQKLRELINNLSYQNPNSGFKQNFPSSTTSSSSTATTSSSTNYFQPSKKLMKHYHSIPQNQKGVKKEGDKTGNENNSVNPFSSQFWRLILPNAIPQKKNIVMLSIFLCLIFLITIPKSASDFLSFYEENHKFSNNDDVNIVTTTSLFGRELLNMKESGMENRIEHLYGYCEKRQESFFDYSKEKFESVNNITVLHPS